MTDVRKGTEEDVELLREALVGRSVKHATFDIPPHFRGQDPYGSRDPQGALLLDDGTILLLAGHEGGCSCGAGDYDLTALSAVNGIMDVQVVRERPTDHEDLYADDEGEGDYVYRIFVLAFGGYGGANQNYELARFDGTDGNGYYGTGFWFTVLRP